MVLRPRRRWIAGGNTEALDGACQRLPREICARIKTTIRGDEVFARVGGEEFVLILPETSLKEAHGCAERIRKLVADLPVEGEKGSIAVTISVGLSHTDGEAGMTAEALIDRADKKLYEAKAAGRNRVIG